MGIITTRNTVAAAALAALVLMAAGCRKKETQASAAVEAPALQVKVLQVQAEAFPLTVAVTGTLVSSTRVDVKAETLGRIVKFPKQEGDLVAAGEAVAWVDQENYQLAVRQAETTVEVAAAALERTKVMAAHNRTELERSQNLIKSGGITDRDLRATEIAERDGQAQVAQAEAQVAQARASLDVARKRLRDTAILAPVGGAIERKFLNAGAYVEAPTAVFTIVDNRKLELESPVPSGQLGQIAAGQRVTFHVNSYPAALFEGRVIEVGPVVDALTRSAKVRIQVANDSGKLKTGMFVEGDILTGVQQQAVVVPAIAVYRGDGTTVPPHVFVAENGKAVQRTIRLGRETDGRLEIVEGLKPGDALVAEQRIELADGVRVQPGK
jgi:RND family efflux transporter MFP subunit